MGYTEVFDEKLSKAIENCFTIIINEMTAKGFSYAEIKYHLDKIYSVAEYKNYVNKVID